MSGQVVFGEKYFERRKDEQKVWRYLDRGAHIILLAPRRSGKTSLLRHLEQNPKNDYIFLYTMVQSCTTEQEFYKQIFDQLYDTDFIKNLERANQKGKDFLSKVLNSIDSINIAGSGVKLTDKNRHITYQDLATVIRKLQLDKKLVIVFDEYPDLIESIYEKDGITAVKNFMKNTRTLCQDTSLNDMVQFIFTGSIGLDSLANRLEVSNLINDQQKLSISTLNEADGVAFIHFLTSKNNSTLQIESDVATYMLNKVQWLMPYYIEILWESLEDHCFDIEKTTPTTDDVDTAYTALFEQTYRSNFNHWVERLKRLETSERALAKAFLNLLARSEEASYNDYFNLSQQEKYQDTQHGYVIDCLEHDGYIFETAPKTYRFTSPILKDWWNRHANRAL
ncbi:ATP-binding protein [Marinomonas mediterranea]|uniref:ATP-binding protein n=1 Tax=Marinomonas mediterranea TaxID=119864 RepID=UPI002348FF3C|nr:ATP-binding protein [Marinomonas mediterranea]WCN13656.1 ATP-binding protein [Marinomonas mediterranea]